ncbi:GNAT family N-acetyltransferase [Clostridium sp. BJN0001]|uniref:GNAT family N-acetyltransferase n=1 Tax=Clostridium sp. BJN0001 TaxID=2930219 RepID=UPI001FD4FA2C|nr:GNAT family N-acetyltransferase [Clostridium sp. BJN0001]
MNSYIEKIPLKTENGEIEDAYLIKLDNTYISDMVNLDKKIYADLNNKEYYFCSPKEEYETIINGAGLALGIIDSKNNLIAMGVYFEPGKREENYAFDIEEIKEKAELEGQIEATVVLKKYRGNKIQKKLCMYLEKESIKNNKKYLCATVHPDNKYSLNTFLSLGFKKKIEKNKYKGLRRTVLLKILQ